MVAGSDDSGGKENWVYYFDSHSSIPETAYQFPDHGTPRVTITGDGMYYGCSVSLGSHRSAIYVYKNDLGEIWNLDSDNFTNAKFGSLTLSKNNEYAYYISTFDDTKYININHIESEIAVWNKSFKSGVQSYAISDNGKYFVILSGDLLEIYEKSNSNDKWNAIWSYDCTGKNLENLIMSGDGSFFIAKDDESETLYVFSKNQANYLWNYSFDTYLEDIDFSKNGEYIVAVENYDENDKIYIFKRSSGLTIWSFFSGADVYSISINKNGQYLSIGTGLPNKVYLYNIQEKSTLISYKVPNLARRVYGISISNSGNELVASTYATNYWGSSGRIMYFEKPDETDKNTPPTIDILQPTESSTVSGVVTITGSSYDADNEISKVEIKIDNDEWLKSTGTSSWSYSWDSIKVDDGIHTISVRCFDGTEYSTIDSLTVNVDNDKTEENKNEKLYEKLVGYWKLDESNGETAYDSSGNKYDGVIYGSSSTSGKFNNGLSFDGDDDYVDFNSVGNLKAISLWIKSDDISSKGRKNPFIGSRDDGFEEEGNFDFTVSDGYLGWELYKGSNRCWGGASKYNGETNFFISDGTWHHVVINVEENNSGTDVFCYFDGFSSEKMISSSDNVYLGNDPLWLGKTYDSGFWRYFDGSLDEISVYSEPLNLNEIKKLNEGVLEKEDDIDKPPTGDENNDLDSEEHKLNVFAYSDKIKYYPSEKITFEGNVWDETKIALIDDDKWFSMSWEEKCKEIKVKDASVQISLISIFSDEVVDTYTFESDKDGHFSETIFAPSSDGTYKLSYFAEKDGYKKSDKGGENNKPIYVYSSYQGALKIHVDWLTGLDKVPRAPLKNARVIIIDETDKKYTPEFTDSHGNVIFNNVHKGSINIEIFKNNYEKASETFSFDDSSKNYKFEIYPDKFYSNKDKSGGSNNGEFQVELKAGKVGEYHFLGWDQTISPGDKIWVEVIFKNVGMERNIDIVSGEVIQHLFKEHPSWYKKAEPYLGKIGLNNKNWETHTWDFYDLSKAGSSKGWKIEELIFTDSEGNPIEIEKINDESGEFIIEDITYKKPEEIISSINENMIEVGWADTYHNLKGGALLFPEDAPNLKDDLSPSLFKLKNDDSTVSIAKFIFHIPEEAIIEKGNCNLYMKINAYNYRLTAFGEHYGKEKKEWADYNYKDLYFSDGQYTVIYADPPFDLHVYDSNNNHVGMNYETGKVDLEISGAEYSDYDPDLKIISLPDSAGEHEIKLVGNDNGAYDFTIQTMNGKDIISKKTFKGNIEKGEILETSFKISEKNDELFLDSVDKIKSFKPSEDNGLNSRGISTDNTPGFEILFLIFALILVFLYNNRKRKH